MIEKLKREWKTFVWGLVSTALEGYELVAYLLDYESLFGSYAPFMHIAIPFGFFLLRKWKDHVVPPSDQSDS